MLTTLWKVIFQIVFISIGMKTVWTNECLSVVFCSVNYESRKTFDEGVMVFVSFSQKQYDAVVGCRISKCTLESHLYSRIPKH